jgi:hypothetical protein
MILNDCNPCQEYYRVFAFGHGHGALISERFSKAAADKRRREWRQSMPDADIRIEKVNVDGWPTTVFYLETTQFGLEGFATIRAAASRATFLARQFPYIRISLANNDREKQTALTSAIANELT